MSIRLLDIFYKKHDQATSIALLLRKMLNLKISKSSLIDVISNHSDNSSFLALSDGLNEFGVNSSAIAVTNDNIKKIPIPFIAHIKESLTNNAFVIISELNDSEVTYINYNGKRGRMPLPSFLEKWSRKIIVIKSTDEVNDKNFIQNSRKELLANALNLFLICCLSFLFYFKPLEYGQGKFFYYFLEVTFLLGLITCLLVLSIEISDNESLASKFCKSNGQENCNSVIKSSHSKIFGLVSWGEIGFLYFFSGLLILFFSSDFSNIEPLYKLSSFISLFFIPYSLYFQRFVIKSWCKFCLFILALVFIQALVSYFIGPFSVESLLSALTNISTNNLVTISGSVSLSILTIYYIKPKFISFEKYITAIKEVKKFKFNPYNFEKILTSQTKTSPPPQNIGIILGNKVGNIKLTIISNPYCTPCGTAHKSLESLLKKNSDIAAHLIFSASSQSSDKRQFPVKCFLDLRDKIGEYETQHELDEWYKSEIKDYLQIVKKYEISDLEKYNKEIDEMNNWCKLNQVTETPTVFINGFRLPAAYSINDLDYFINHLKKMFSGEELGTSLNPSQFN